MKLITKIVGACLGLVLATSVGFATLANSVRPTRASAHTITLNNNNSPDLINGEGTNDLNGVIWEYHNVSNNANGHITINHQGYFGISSSSNWGYTGIEGITANFSSGELWLLKSVDGVNWNESAILETGVENNTADNWRYIRFYSYADIIDVSSISFGYSCSGISSAQDVDNAKVNNVLSMSSNLEAEACAGQRVNRN